MKDDVRSALKDRQIALGELVKAIREFRKFTDQPLTVRGSDYATAFGVRRRLLHVYEGDKT